MLRPIYLYKFDPKRLPQGKPDDVELITVSNASELPTVVDNDVLVMGKDAEEFFAANVPGAYATVLVTKIDDFDKFVGDVWIQREFFVEVLLLDKRDNKWWSNLLHRLQLHLPINPPDEE